MDETQIIDRINKLRTTLDNSINTLRTELITNIQTEINRLELPKVHHKVTNNYVDLSTKLDSIHKELSEKLLSLDNFVKDNFLSLKKEFNGKTNVIEGRLSLLESKESVTKEDITSIQSSLFSAIKTNSNSIKSLSEELEIVKEIANSGNLELQVKISGINKTLSKQEAINKEVKEDTFTLSNGLQVLKEELVTNINFTNKLISKQDILIKENKDDLYNLSDRFQVLKGELEQNKISNNNKISELTTTISYLPTDELIIKINESLEQLKTKLDIGLCSTSKIVNNHKDLIEGVLSRLNTIENKPNKELTRQDILNLLTIDGIVSFDSMMKLPFIPLPNSLQDTSNLVIAGDIKDKRVKLFVNGNWVIIA